MRPFGLAVDGGLEGVLDGVSVVGGRVGGVEASVGRGGLEGVGRAGGLGLDGWCRGNPGRGIGGPGGLGVGLDGPGGLG